MGPTQQAYKQTCKSHKNNGHKLKPHVLKYSKKIHLNQKLDINTLSQEKPTT